ncbi:MAG TPA: DUF3857 domain-containing protein [Kofleriaceae bacterium]|nr:DUF3857 domain-containing protein [Kofleriaceae bacterium]
MVGLLLLIWALPGGSAAAAPPGGSDARSAGLGEGPMAAPAAELRRVASAAGRAEGAGSTLLLDEVVYRVEAGGVTTARYRSVVAIDSAAGMAEWRSYSASWSPWFENTPTIDARVLDREGTFHRLDPSTVELGPATGWSSPTAGDRRQLRAPLPAVAPGGIVEIVLTIQERAPLFAAGSVHSHAIGDPTHPVAQSRVVIDAPAGMRLAVAADLHGVLASKVETAAGRTRRIYEAGSVAPMPEQGESPPDVSTRPWVGFSTGTSWSRVARDYDALVRQRIAAGPLPGDVPVPRGASRRQTIACAVEILHGSLHSTGLVLGDKDVAPLTPTQVWQRRYGDSEDLAAFLVALLARAGIEAHVALVDGGPDRELSAELPGLGEVDRALVYVPGEKLWIDPESDLARPGQLSAGHQGRLALVAAPSTGGPVRTPGMRSADNYIIVDRSVTLVESGRGSVSDVSRSGGLPEVAMRAWLRQAAPETLKRVLEAYVWTAYTARLGRYRVSRADDLSAPFTVEVAAEEAASAKARAQDASVLINVRPLFEAVVPDLRLTNGEGDRSGRPSHPLQLHPHVVEWRYRIQFPDGFEPSSLPSEEQSFGPATYSLHFEAKGHVVRGRVRFALSRGRIEPAELEALARGVQSVLARPEQRVEFEHRVNRKVERGDLVGALIEAKRLVDRMPDSAAQHSRFSYVLATSGITADAVEAGERAVQLAPAEPWVHSMQSWVHRHDAVGRSNVAGFNRRGAIAEMEKAVNVSGEGFYHQRLGHLYSYGDDGTYLGGDLARAAQSLAKACELGEPGLEDLLMQVLLRRGDTAELGRLAARIKAPEVSGAFRLAAARDDAALQRELASIAAASREKAVTRLAAAYLQVTDYRRLQRLARLAGVSGKLTPAQQAAIARLRVVPVDPNTPADVLARWMADSALADGKRWLSRDVLEADAAGRMGSWIPDPGVLRHAFDGVHGTPQLDADVLRSVMDVRLVERAGPVEQVEVTMLDRPGSHWKLYISHEAPGDRPRILTVGGVPQLLAPAVLRAADAGRLDDARRILDWAAADPAAGKSRNLAGIQVLRFWMRGLRGDLRRIRLAAAGLLVEIDPAKSLAVLERECPRTGDVAVADACRLVRAAALSAQGKHREAEEAVKGMAVEPDAAFFGAKARGLLKSHAWAELDQLAAGAVPDGARVGVQRLLAWSWVARGKPDRARAINDSLRTSPAGNTVGWRNFACWMVLFTGGDLTPVIADLERAIASSSRPGWAAVHTLAVAYARGGRAKEALATIQRAADLRGRADPEDQLVIGRIAQSAGLTAAARRAYQTVISAPKASNEVGSSADLARRWLAELPR